MNYLIAGIVLLTIAIAILAIKTIISTKEANFEAKKPLSNPEQILYFKLKKALPEHNVLAQVSFSRFLKAVGGTQRENWKNFATIKQKVADFVVCKKDFTVIAIVELDDKTHNIEKDEKRDLIIVRTGIKVIRWNVKNIPGEEEIKTVFKKIGENNEHHQ